MAISHVQPVLLLLAPLFFLPVLRAIKFEYCDAGYDFGNITSVVIKSETDDTTIIVYGHANANNEKSLKEGSVSVNLGETGPFGPDRFAYYLNEVSDVVPIKPGSNFFLTMTHVPVRKSDDKVIVILYDDEEEYSQTGVSLRILCIKFNPQSSTKAFSE